MAFRKICRICLCVNVRMFVLKKTSLWNLYKTLTNSFMDEDEEPIIVCFTCHARLISCLTLQQQAVESKAVLEQLLAGGFMDYSEADYQIFLNLEARDSDQPLSPSLQNQ